MDNWDRGVEDVVQRKCGTCRHFEEGGIAASGRCLHPLRRDLEQMVLVRRNELACRNGWDEDLWEPKEAEPTPDSPSSGNTSASAPDNSANGQPADLVDRVASITIVPDRNVPQRAGPVSTSATDQPVHGIPDQAEDPIIEQRSAIQVAKRRRQEALAREWARAQALVPILPDEELRERPVSPCSNGTSGTAPKEAAPEPTMGSGQAALRSVSVMPLHEFAQPARRQTALPPAAHPIVRLRAEGGDPTPAPSPRTGNGSWAPARSGRQWADPSAEPGASRPIPRRSLEPEPTSRPEVQEPEPLASELPPVDIQPPDRPLPDQLACLVQKCGTCRDFRPAEGGDRGWCNNHFAFDHRRMVHPDELACASTIGVWWVANDDWWLQRADISHHACPTPSVDEHLGRTSTIQTEHGAAPETNGRFGRASTGQSRPRGR
jgi:hypothetical protein